MSVTKNRHNKLLKMVIDFLNLDFGSKISSQLKGKKDLKKILIGNFQGNEKVASSVQAEMKGDLSPIAARKSLPESIYPYRERWSNLCFKLTEMNFTRFFDVSPKQEKDGRIVVWGSNILYEEQKEGRGSMYAFLADLLENGEIERLRRCPICRKFFVAARRNSRFCSQKCGVVWDRKDAANRQRRHRVIGAMKYAAKEAEKRSQRAIQRFEEFIMTAQTNYQGNKYVESGLISCLGQGDLSKGWKMIKEWVEQLKCGVSVQEIWGNLPQSIKNQFQSK
jgi:predicted nucleic acid-binding Zn ribbon protein